MTDLDAAHKKVIVAQRQFLEARRIYEAMEERLSKARDEYYAVLEGTKA